MQLPYQQLRPNIIAPLRRYGRQVRQKLKDLSLLKLIRLPLNLPDRAKQNVGRQRGRKFHSDSSEAFHYDKPFSLGSDSQSTLSARQLSVHSSRLVFSSSRTSVVNIPVSNIPLSSNISSERSGFDESISKPVDILLKFPGDGPKQSHQAVASIDTQLVKVNLMRWEVWDKRLNEDRRGRLELDHDAYVTTLKSGRIPIIGVARGVEWHLKYGPRTYVSDFHVVEMKDFDVLIGSDTITQYQLTRATITTSASNPNGFGHNVTLRAIIDETIEENLISRNRLEQLQDLLKVYAMPLGSAKTLKDSRHMLYEAQSKVCLLIRPCDGTRTETFWFYIAETETTLVAGGHDIILAKSWETKFPTDAQDGVKTYRAAPTVYRKGDNGEEWKKNALEKSKKILEYGASFEADWEEKEKGAKEQKEEGKGPANGK
ncbi:hypothetical protein BDW67DRAFT_179772 [Aspergillus spinulosporus]